MATERKDSVAAAEAALTKAYPEPSERYVVLKQLLDSAAHADKIAPGAWAVTLKPKGFRLNVGVTEVLVASPEAIGVNLAARPDEFEPSEGCELIEVNYAARPGSTRYNGYVDDFAQIAPDLQKAHLAFIDACAFSPSGKPYAGSVNTRFHNPGLMAYARSFVADYGKILEEQAIEPSTDELVVSEDLYEGRLVQVLVNAYERNAKARRLCIEHYGHACSACGFDFAKSYGAAAKGYIQVHHVVPVAQIAAAYKVDPVRDLRPVCANCHAVLHLRDEPYTVEEIASMLKRARDRAGDA